MSRSFSRHAISLTTLGAVAACFLAGLDTAQGQGGVGVPPPPPACVSVTQKYTYWWDSTLGKLGAFTPGGGPTKTTSFTAAPVVWTGVPVCPKNNFIANVGTYDRWSIPFGTLTCTPAPGAALVDMTVTPAQLGIVPGTLAAGLTQNNCT